MVALHPALRRCGEAGFNPRPPDIGLAEGALRPDVLVIESGEVIIPGDVDFGYDIGLPAGTSYACLAETALLAMEGRFEDYTLGRRIEMERVKEIYRLFQKHGFRLAGLRSHAGAQRCREESGLSVLQSTA